MRYEEAYLVIIQAREDFPNTMTEEEKKIMSDHYATLKRYMDQDKLILAGPTLDDSGGYIILNVSSKEEAVKLMSQDPSVLAGIMTVTYHPFRVSLIKCPSTNIMS
ncbi:MAG: YciI family protein [Candidatus Heimdallarchaeota archaeon]